MFYIPTKQEVLNLKVGDTARDCFGKKAEVVEIYGRGVDVRGKWYVLYYTSTKSGGSASSSMREDELMRTVELSKHFTSWQLDDIEEAMLKPASSLSEAVKNIFEGKSTGDLTDFVELLEQAAQHAWERRAG